MKAIFTLFIAFACTSSALAEDSGVVWTPAPTKSAKLLSEIDVTHTKPEPEGSVLELLSGVCNLGYPAPADAKVAAIGPHGERLAAGKPARIVSSAGQIQLKGCSDQQATTVRVRWETSNGPMWEEYKADAFTPTPKMKEYQDLRAKEK